MAELARGRLLLTSYGLGPYGHVLRDLAGPRRHVGVVRNALDGFTQTRAGWLETETKALREAGFFAEELDLRDYFGDDDGLRHRLEGLGAVWVVGGNTFVLARAMRASRFDAHAAELVEAERLVNAGYSAGACVTGLELRGVHLMDERDLVPAMYPAGTSSAALGWLPQRIVPHWRSDHTESPLAALAVAYLDSHELAYRTLRDGEAIVIDGDAAAATQLVL